MQFLFSTNAGWVPALLRITLGFTFFAHGAQKLTGWFGGYGFSNTMDYFTQYVGLPWIIGFGVILIEFFGGLLLVVGFGARVISMLVFCLIIGIISKVHWQYGFFMNWEGNQKGEGIEFFVLALVIAASVAVLGAGSLSIDKYIHDRKRKSLGSIPFSKSMAA